MAASDSTARRDDEKDFFLAALQQADQARENDHAIDREVLENYMVQPPGGHNYRHKRGGKPVLIDPETHNVLETLLAFLMVTLMGEKGYISATAVGSEDALSGKYAGRLLERNNRVRGNYRALYTWLKDTLLFGASTVFPAWIFQEGARSRRLFDVDPLTGAETFEDVTFEDVLRNDCVLTVIDNSDLYVDPSNDTIESMQYAIRRFTMPKYAAQQMADDGRWFPHATRRALDSAPTPERIEDEWRESIDRQDVDDLPEDYHEVVGYEMYALVPYKTQDRVRNRRLTMLNNELVETRPNPTGISRVIPWYEGVVNPIAGRFRGVAPGAVARFTQDFASGMLMNLASAVTKKVRSPVAYNEMLAPSQELLEAWKGPIPTQGDPAGIKTLDYNPPLQEGFALWQAMTQRTAEMGGAQEGFQGQGFGTKRMSATETSMLMQQQVSRPNMMASLFEHEYLPAMAQGIFEMHQRWLEGTKDLQRRIGATQVDPRQPHINDIQGDFDIEFIGSQRMQSKQIKMQFLKESMQIFASVPGAAPLYPWAEALTIYLENADLRELEHMVGSKAGIERFIATNFLMQQAGGGGAAAGNGNAASVQLGQSTASGLLPAQATGQAL